MRKYFKSFQYSLLLGFFVLICLAASAAAEVLPGQVMVDPNNPFWLVYNRDLDGNGRLDPFFLCGPGDPEGFLYRGKRHKDGTRDGDQATIIKRLQQHGGNCIYMIAVRTHGGDAWKDERSLPAIYPDKKHNPWVEQDPKKGLNEAILAQWEEWFTLMDEQGIVIYFFFYDDAIKVGKTLGWPLSENGNLHPREKEFIQALVNRFEHHKHLIWCVMEEGQEIGAQWKRHVSQIAAAIREADDHRHPIATHQLGGNRFFHAADRNLDQFAIQTNADAVGNPQLLHEWLVQIRENSPGLYSLNMSEDKIQGELCEKGDREGIRKRSWASAMAGAYVMVIGMDGAETPKEWLGDCRRLREFFESTPIDRMASHDELAANETAYVLANPGYAYILYSPSARDTMGVKGIAPGQYKIRWFDCETGKSVFQPEVRIDKAPYAGSIPQGIGDEVAVYLRRVDAKEPMPAVNRALIDPIEQKEGNIAPEPADQAVKVKAGESVAVQLRYTDADGGPGPYKIMVVKKPEHGKLSGVGNDRTYHADKGYAGADSFSWKVHDGADESARATVLIQVEE